MKLKRYRFKTKSVKDCRPLIDMKDISMPWWCSSISIDFSYCVIVCYLPEDEDLKKYWDDAYDIEYDLCDEIEYSSRFPKPSYLKKVKKVMEDRYYYLTVEDKLVSISEVMEAALIVHGENLYNKELDYIRNYANMCSGILKEIKNPSVEFLLSHGKKVHAVKLYRDTHYGITFSGAYDYINKLAEDM